MPNNQIKSVVLHARVVNESVIQTLRELVEFLHKLNVTVYCEEYTAKNYYPTLPSLNFSEMANKADLAIVLGGDGSMLGVAREISMSETSVLGINKGHLGFLTDLKPQNLKESLRDIICGEYFFEERFLLQTEIYINNTLQQQSLALNEAVIHCVKTAHMIDFSIFVNDKFMYSQKADGLIISTPTGSTAYNLSAGGPIIEPSLNIISLVPMFPQSMNCRPLLLRADSEIKILFATKCNAAEAITVTCDGQIIMDATENCEIIIKKSPKSLKICHPYSYDYFETLRSKLGFATKIVE